MNFIKNTLVKRLPDVVEEMIEIIEKTNIPRRTINRRNRTLYRLLQ